MPIDKNEIARIISERGAVRNCHRCGKTEFTVIDGYSTISLQEDISTIKIGGRSIPVAYIACNHCGAISAHALGALGLLPTKEEGKSNE